MFFLIWVVTLVAWITAVLGVSSVGVTLNSLGQKEYNFSSKEKGLIAFMVVGLWWLLFNIHYMTQFIVCNSAATYYFDSNRQKEGSASVIKATYLGAVTHAGSVAYCGLLMTFVMVLRTLSEALTGAARDSKDGAA